MLCKFTIFRQRMQVSLNEEDKFFNKNFEVKTHDDVERIRRAHLNDLENLVPFFLIGLMFIFTEPNEIFAAWLFRIVGITRIAHSCIYVFKVRQPFRAICFYITYVILLYMILSSIVYFIRL
jgi:glutathione S-transferase